MAKKPRIPAAESIIYCVSCHKPTNGKGSFGPECQCEVESRAAKATAHVITTGLPNWR